MLTTLRNLSCHLDPGISSLAQLDPEQVTYSIQYLLCIVLPYYRD